MADNTPDTRPTSEPERSRLVKPTSLVIVGGVLVVALVLLFPARRFRLLSQTDADNTGPTAVSIQYLTALLRANPEDRQLRLNLATQLAAAGEFARAQQVMVPLADSDDLDVRWLRLELAWQRFNAAKPDAPERAPRRAALIERLQALQADQATLSVERVDILAQRWLALDAPDKAATLYAGLAQRDKSRAYHWNALAARWSLAAGKPAAAARFWLAAFDATGDADKRRQAAMAALDAAQQSDSDDGLMLAQRFISAYPKDAEFLDRGIDIALSRNRLVQAQAWSRQYLALKPNDRDALERDTRIALANNQLQDALAGLEKLVADHPDDAALRAKLAQVQMWSGQGEKALANYELLARTQGSDEYDEKVIEIAQQVYDTQAVLAALDRIRRRHPLNTEQRTLLVNILNSEGDPDRAISIIRSWVNNGPAPREMWVKLATLEEQTGALKESLGTWNRIADTFGRQLDETQARAKLHILNWDLDGALAVLTSLPQKPSGTGDANVYYWNTLGEVAWQLNNKAQVVAAYEPLMASGQLNDAGYQRLIRAAADEGDVELAMRATRKGWAQLRSTELVLNMLGIAQVANRPDLTRELLGMARQRPSQFVDSADYWQFVGDYAFLTHDLDQARLAYLRALAIEPSNSGYRSALLYTLAEDNREDDLLRYLRAWESDAANDPRMWQTYAMGYSTLGMTRKAIPYFDRSVHQQPDNYLLILDYADALEAGRRFESARKMREYALVKLRPRLMADLQAQGKLTAEARQQDSRILGTQAALLGPDRARDWLGMALDGRRGKQLDAVDIEMLFSYYLSQEQPAYARYWLLQGQRRRYETADWQQLAVALQSNDQVEMQRLIAARGDGTIGISDRINTMRQLDFRAEALMIALDHRNDREPYAAGVNEIPRYAAELYQEMPQNAGSRLLVRRVSDLDIADEQIFFRLSGEKWSAGMQFGARQLRRGSDIELDGLDNEQYAMLDIYRRQRRGLSQFTIGTVQADDSNLLRLGFRQDWQFTNRLNGAVYGDYNDQVAETSRLRVLGTRDQLGTSLSYAFTARDTVNLAANYSAYHSREDGYFLGQGYILESSLAHSLMIGPTRQLQVRLFANTEQNFLEDDLSPDIAARLPVGTQLNDVIPRRFSFMGSGFTLSRGQPGAEYPTVASPRYALDVDAGYVLPDSSFGITANFSVGMRILGSDELSFSLGADQTGTDVRQNAYTGLIQYQYFFGR